MQSYFDFNREFYASNHPSNDILDSASIEKLTVNDIFKWHRLTYRPGNAILSISGGFKETMKHLEKFFRGMPSGTIDKRLMVKPVKMGKDSQLKEVGLNGKWLDRIGIGAPDEDLNSPAFKSNAYI